MMLPTKIPLWGNAADPQVEVLCPYRDDTGSDSTVIAVSASPAWGNSA